MMNILGYNRKEITQLGGIHTAQEIDQQPELWKEIYQNVKIQKKEIQHFIKGVFEDADSVILTGAGTSAYIGLIVEGEFQKCCKKHTKTVPTTHLVTHPADYITKNKRVLLISFARSGNSPESKAAVKMADHFSDNCHHLIITCNAEGDLAKMSVKNGRYVFCLPEKANDRSLAMTSSFSGMVLAAILKEQYLGLLYDLGYDKPETHVISKGDTLHYAFYAEDWSGKIELRGLENKSYVIRDYFNNKNLGEVQGPTATIAHAFNDFLLIEVYPK